jgi:hypothetical protein
MTSISIGSLFRRAAGALLACVIAPVAVHAADAEPVALKPFAGEGSVPAPPWKVTGLPNQKKPFTRFSVVDLEGHKALRIDADSSYGNLLHPMAVEAPAGLQLAWQWRVEQLNDAADINVRTAEDIALKVCTMWDLALERIPFGDRQALRFLRSRTEDTVPGATVCYIWDPHLPVGTQVDSPFTRRLRYIVLRSGSEGLRRWTPEKRNIAADFLRLFGDETREHVPLIGIAVGADSDNTRAKTQAHVADLVLSR